MNMKFALYDNEVLPQEKVILSPINTGILIGDGVFTTLVVRDGIPIFFDKHCKRLQNQAKDLNLETIEISVESIHELIKMNNAQKGIYRLKLCYVACGNFFQKIRNSILLGILAQYTLVNHPVRLLPYPYPIETPFSRYKTLAYSHRFFLLQWAIRQKFDDVITMNGSNHILEATFSNILWYKNKTFYYPNSDLPVFFGITLEIIKRIISSLKGYIILPSYKKIQDINSSEQWFILNSLTGIKPITQIGDIVLYRNQRLENVIARHYTDYISSWIIRHRYLDQCTSP